MGQKLELGELAKNKKFKQSLGKKPVRDIVNNLIQLANNTVIIVDEPPQQAQIGETIRFDLSL